MVKLPTRVVIESPYAGDVEANQAYLAECMRDCIMNYGEAPFASHGLYTQCLDDDHSDERTIGINAGFAWLDVAEYSVVYIDRGISEGMKLGIAKAISLGLEVEYRKLPVTNGS